MSSSDWQPTLAEYRRRLAAGRAMGGSERVAKRHQRGQANARELIELLCDLGSFKELGTLAGGYSYDGGLTAPADALIGGTATIDSRPIVLGAEDFTVMGGSIGAATNAKKVRLATLAAQEGVPYLMFLDGAGERLGGKPERRAYSPNDMQLVAQLSGLVPTIAVIIGSSAGHGAITGLLMDFVIMLRGSVLFSAGPPLVRAAIGEEVSKEELGGAEMHTAQSGVAHNLVEDAAEACLLVRRWLSFLPSSARERPPAARSGGAQRAPRTLNKILDLIPNSNEMSYDVTSVIKELIDSPEEWLEFQPAFGKAIICGLARLGAHSVALVANQPLVQAGAITKDAADKATHFLKLCDAYHLPVIFLADNPGVMSGSQAERAGTLRAAAAMYAAQCRYRGVKLHVTLRKAFGFGSSLMGMNPFDGQTVSYALPGISLGAMPASGGSDAANLDAEARRAAVEVQNQSTWTAGDNMAFDEIIEPTELRNALLRGLLLSARRRALAPEPGPGVLP